MDCCLRVEEVEAFVARGLSDDECSRVEEHVASCAACREAVENCRRDGELARGIQGAFEELTIPAETSGARLASGADSLVIDAIEGYEILHEIHRGGQGVVYKAVQLATKRTVALKVLLHGVHASQKQRQRFEREIDLVAGMQHPNIVTIYDSGLTQGHHYFAMEYVHGRRLDDYVLAANLSIKEILRLFEKICVAVNFAHQRGVIHRDIKPSNICVDADGEPRVLDFGLAKSARSDVSEGLPVTVPGDFMGTPAYASPEQVSGDPRLVDIRTDVYSLGVILFEMLTGAYPYEVSGPVVEVFRNIAEAEPKRPSAIRAEIDNEVETIVLQSLAKERERRYQSAGNLARDVGRYLRGEPLDAKRDSTWYVVRKSLRRYRVAASIAVAFVLVLAMSTIALSIMYRNQSRARADAEAARISESEQRTLAEKRAEELEIVTEFQQSMMSGIDAQAMGQALYADLEDRVRQAIEAKGASTEETDSAVQRFAEVLRGTNATDTALKLVDEQVLRRAVKAIESDFADQPVIRAALQQTVASTYRKLGHHSSAMPLQEASLQTRRTELGEDHPDTLTSMDDMGNLLKEMGEFEEAYAYCRKALAGRRKVLGRDHPDTLCSINNMGFLLQYQGKLAEAEPFYREAVARKRAVLGDEHPETLTSINNLGFLLQNRGRFAEAESFYREALEGRRRTFGEEHWSTLETMNNMGMLLRLQGKFAEAEQYFRKVVEGFRRVFGEDHTRTLTSMNNMGALLYSQGKLSEAESYWSEVLAVRRRVLGDNHPDTLSSLSNFGYLLQSQDRLGEAESCWREALEGRRRVLGEDHPKTLISINAMGVLLKEQGKLAESERYYREALEKKRRVLGEDHPSTLQTVACMGDVLLEQNNHAEAAALLIPAEAAFRQKYTGGNAPRLAEFLVTLGGARVGMGFEPERFALAEANLIEAHSILAESRGAAHKDTRRCVQRLVDLYHTWQASEPNGGYASKAAEWRARLPDATKNASASKTIGTRVTDSSGADKTNSAALAGADQ